MREKDYSQHGEQKLLETWFKKHRPKNKFLVDVGAFGPELSNSYRLLKKGWEGLLIEPSQIRYRICLEGFNGLKMKVINCGASDSVGKLPFYIHDVAGHDSFLKDWGHSNIVGEPVTVMVYPLSQILRDWGVPNKFDLLSIDTEGMDFKIMKKFLEDGEFRPGVIITEGESYKDPIIFYGQHGYRILEHLGDKVYGNYVFVTIRN